MKLEAELTHGWPAPGPDALCAATLHQRAGAAEHYGDALFVALREAAAAGGQIIAGLDGLFRRRAGGFGPIKRFVGALAQLPATGGLEPPLLCRIDAFAYAFLQGAKNLDLLLPVAAEQQAQFKATLDRWEGSIAALERLERLGEPLPGESRVALATYLALRRIVTRPSGRDERRVLATLLVSGPSSLRELSEDLRLNYTLGERTVAVYEPPPLRVVERRGDRFAIRAAALPVVLFCLRETMGLDPLPALRDLLREV